MSILAGILAGGRGRRMLGQDKPMAMLAGKPLIAHVIARLRPQVGQIILNANDSPERFAEFKLPVIADNIEGYQGPLAGIETLMAGAARTGASHILITPADTPFLPETLCETLLNACEDASTVRIASSNNRRHPVVALWPTDLAQALAAHIRESNDLSMAAFVKKCDHIEVEFPLIKGTDPFFNINSPEDLARAAQILA